MPRILSWIPTVALMLALAGPSAAITVIVPDDHPTIQAALDAKADVVQVRGGLVPERLTIAHEVTIEPGPGPPYLWSWAPMPMVQSLVVVPEIGGGTYAPRFTVRGVRFLGVVGAEASTTGYRFESCRFDSGFADPTTLAMAGHYASVRNCMFVGDVRVTGAVQFVGNTVIGGTARIFSDGSHDISHNYITGPAEAGLELHLDASYGPISRNTIRNTGDGIRFLRANPGSWLVTHNDIADCSGDGIVWRVSESAPIARADSNRIVNCGGAGIAIRGVSENGWLMTAKLTGNYIRGTGGDGVFLENAFAYPVRGNTILESGGDGFRASQVSLVEGNVIGLSVGTGFLVTGTPESPVIGNTFFLNGGGGMRFGSAYGFIVFSHNISAFNFGPGLQIDGGWEKPTLSCNDWFANAGGATVGVPPGATDLSLPPLFCDMNDGDVSLSADSPLLTAEDCGLIGALGEGCPSPTSVAPAPAQTPVPFRAWPVPSQGGVAFSLVPSDDPVELEVFDVAGARRWHAALPMGATTAQWDRREVSGASAPPGVYFARLRRSGAEIARVRVVLTE